MQIEKIVLEKSAEALLEQAEDCFDLAKTQHKLAEHQHDIAMLQQQNADKQQGIAARQHCDADQLATKADKLVALGHALEANAVEIKGDTMLVQRDRESAVSAPRTVGPLRLGMPPGVLTGNTTEFLACSNSNDQALINRPRPYPNPRDGNVRCWPGCSGR